MYHVLQGPCSTQFRSRVPGSGAPSGKGRGLWSPLGMSIISNQFHIPPLPLPPSLPIQKSVLRRTRIIKKLACFLAGCDVVEVSIWNRSISCSISYLTCSRRGNPARRQDNFLGGRIPNGCWSSWNRLRRPCGLNGEASKANDRFGVAREAARRVRLVERSLERSSQQKKVMPSGNAAIPSTCDDEVIVPRYSWCHGSLLVSNLFAPLRGSVCVLSSPTLSLCLLILTLCFRPCFAVAVFRWLGVNVCRTLPHLVVQPFHVSLALPLCVSLSCCQAVSCSV